MEPAIDWQREGCRSRLSNEDSARGSRQNGTSAELHRVEMLPALEAARDMPASTAWLSAMEALDMTLLGRCVMASDWDGRACRWDESGDGVIGLVFGMSKADRDGLV